MFYHAQIVSNKQVGQVQLFLQFLHQVDDLRLDGYIQCGDRFITDDQIGGEGQGALQAYPLALAAGELMG